MNAAIIGATGLVGQRLLRQLVASRRFDKIWVIGRRAPTLQADAIHFTRCELSELSHLTPPFTITTSFCCLGTTLKQAGSQDAFRAIDKQAVIDFVSLCDARLSAVITALGADVNSKVFYNRIKGETQEAINLWATSQQKAVQFYQPSLLLGKRAQRRIVEDLGQSVMPMVAPLMWGCLRKYRPIDAERVAAAMLHFSKQQQSLTIDNATMLTLTV